MSRFTQDATLEWRPNASLDALRARAVFNSSIRRFFSQRGVLEVDTPILGRASVTDPHIESLALGASPTGEGGEAWYLQTSPEFAMKRLLAAGIGDIYQIAHVFRQGEHGRLHNPEFAMLEWYRLDYDHHRLMDEVAALLTEVCQSVSTQRCSYREVFLRHLNLDPHLASLQELIACACDLQLGQNLRDVLIERDQWLDLLMGGYVGPRLGLDSPVFVYDFPPSQAALARIGEHGLAERFELFVGGVEIANGYHELADANELLQRFERDNVLRGRLGLNAVNIDYKLLAAMQYGLPACAGVAIGLDRLFMWHQRAASLAQVIGFNCERI